MALSNISRNLVFRRAGHFIAIPYQQNGLPDYKRMYNSKVGIVQQIQRNFSRNTIDLPDGNSDYPAAQYITTQEGTNTITMSTYDPELEAIMAGAEVLEGETANSAMWELANFVVPETGEAEYTFPDNKVPSRPDEAFVLKDIYGNTFEATGSGADIGEGKYFYDSGAKKLVVSDTYAGQTLYLSYEYTGADVYEVAYKENPSRAVFQFIIVGTVLNLDESKEYKVVIVYDRCAVTGEITPPVQSTDPSSGWTMTVNVLKPRDGRKPVDIKFEGLAAN